MSTQDPEELLDNVISYLKQQQEMFGDFSVPADSKEAAKRNPKKDSADPDSASDSSNKPPTAKHESVSDSTKATMESTDTGRENKKDTTDEEQNESTNEFDTSITSSSNNTEQPESAAAAASSPSQEHSLFATNPDASGNIYDQVEGCNSLKELYELCRDTNVLRTDLEGTNLVFGVGNPDADLVLVGEAPGSEEDKQGEPFVGRAGQLLNKILKAIELKRDEVYIANILKHRPPNNRNPLPEEVKRSLPFLMKQLDLIDPKLILCLGKVAANTLLEKKDSLKNMRGTFYTFMNRYELMVTYHPAALLRNKRFKRPTWEDMKTLRERFDELTEEDS